MFTRVTSHSRVSIRKGGDCTLPNMVMYMGNIIPKILESVPEVT